MKGTPDRGAIIRAFLGYLLLASASDVFTWNVVAPSGTIGVLTDMETSPNKSAKLRFRQLK